MIRNWLTIFRLVIKEEDALIALDIIHANVLGIPRIKTTHTPIFQNSMMKGKVCKLRKGFIANTEQDLGCIEIIQLMKVQSEIAYIYKYTERTYIEF